VAVNPAVETDEAVNLWQSGELHYSKAEVEAKLAGKVSKTGDTMTGALTSPLFVSSTTVGWWWNAFTDAPSGKHLHSGVYGGAQIDPEAPTSYAGGDFVWASYRNDGLANPCWEQKRIGTFNFLHQPTVNGGVVWHAGNFDPGTKVNVATDQTSGARPSGLAPELSARWISQSSGGHETFLHIGGWGDANGGTWGLSIRNDLGTTGGTIAPNAANGNVQKITLNSALTINAFTSPVAGQSITLIIYGGTAYTSITSTMKFAGGVKTLTGTASCIDILSIYYDGTNYFASLGKGFA
jgi:hypothetical protein